MSRFAIDPPPDDEALEVQARYCAGCHARFLNGGDAADGEDEYCQACDRDREVEYKARQRSIERYDGEDRT